jgi:hypothetical protein
VAKSPASVLERHEDLEEESQASLDEEEEDDFEEEVHAPLNAQTIESSLYENNHMEDPIVVTIREVCAKTSHEAAVVSACVHAMFDKGLRYDDAESVISELNKHDHEKEPVPKQSSPKRTKIPKQKSAESCPPQDPVVSTIVKEPKLEGTFLTADTSQESKSESTAQMDTTSELSSPVGVEARLSIAASHPSLSDGLRALCDWFHLNEDSAPCDTLIRSEALGIIFIRLIDNPAMLDDDLSLRSLLSSLLYQTITAPVAGRCDTLADMDERTLLQPFFNRLFALFLEVPDAKSCGLLIERGGQRRSRGCDELVAKLTGLVISLRKSFVQSNISEELTLSMELEKLRMSLRNEFSIEAAIDDPSDFRNQLLLRETMHGRLDLTLQARDITGQMVQSQHASLHVSSHDDKLTIPQLSDLSTALLADVGETVHSMAQHRKNFRHIHSSIDRIKTEHAADSGPIKAQLLEVQAKTAGLCRQREALLQQLALTDNELATTTSHTKMLQAAIAEMDSKRDNAFSQLGQSDLTSFHIDERIENLIRKVGEIDLCVPEFHDNYAQKKRLAISSTVGRSPDIIRTDQLNSCQAACSDYCRVESNCILMLVKRIQHSDAKVQNLKIEVDEYRSLGMENMVNDIDTSILRLKENHEDDTNATACLLSAMDDMVRKYSGDKDCIPLDVSTLGYIAAAVEGCRTIEVTIPPLLAAFATQAPQQSLNLTRSSPSTGSEGGSAQRNKKNAPNLDPSTTVPFIHETSAQSSPTPQTAPQTLSNGRNNKKTKNKGNSAKAAPRTTPSSATSAPKPVAWGGKGMLRPEQNPIA